eukprot:g4982.t1
MFVEQCQPNSGEARMFEDIEKRAVKRMRSQRGGALYVHRNEGASRRRRRRVVRRSGAEPTNSARTSVASNRNVESNVRTPLIAGSNRSSTRNGGSGRSSDAFVQQLGRINRMFGDSDDDSEDESDDEPIVNIAQMIGQVLNGFVSGQGGEGIASDIRNYANQEGLQALMSQLVSTGNVDNRCASKEFLEHLRKNHVEPNDVPSSSPQCPICQNPFVRNDVDVDGGEPSGLKRTMSDSSTTSSSSVGAVAGSIAKLPCGHYFCLDCITPWLTSHVTCPVCRAEIPNDYIVRNRDGRNRNHSAAATTSSSGQTNLNYSEQRSGFMRARTDSLD